MPHNLHRPALVLIELQRTLFDRLTRLQAIEQRLARAVARRRGHSGRRAFRHVERDRRRLARDLHTGVGQLLAGVRIQLELLDGLLPEPPAGVGPALDRIAALAGDALDQIRSVSRRLHPPAWQALPIDQALRRLWETSGVPQRYIASFDAPPLPHDLDPDIKTLLYRAAQEALSNIVRHARATRVSLTLAASSTRVALAVTDDGIGLQPRALAATTAAGDGLGLRALREQAADLGGRVVLRSGPHGAVFEISVPLES